MTCALCGSDTDLQLSHVLPAFLFRWLREASGTGGHIRNSKQPNLRVQDGLKIPMLCLPCEGRFNGFETPFANQVFYPLGDDGGIRVGYDDWMLKFCVSVSWRVLRHARDGGHLQNLAPEQVRAAEGALQRWAGFLKGDVSHPGEFEQHFLPLGPIDSHTMPDMPDNMNRYLLRAIEMDIAHAKQEVMTYAKLGPFALFGFVQPPAEQWQGTKVHVRHGVLEPRDFVLPRALYDFLADKARKTRNIYSKMSDKQLAKIDRAAEDNIDSLATSKQFEAMMHDARLFGESAIVRRDRKR